MKLDPRIIEGKRPLSCLDTEEAKQFIGKEGYFANSIDEFCNLNDVIDGKLFDVDDSTNMPFDCIDAVSDNYYYSFFLPKEWVKHEPEWRPYLIDEWLQEHNFGDMIEFRHKGSKREFTVMFTGYVQGGNDAIRVVLGDWAENFDNLFEYYELIDKTNDGKFVWKPFGIEVKE